MATLDIAVSSYTIYRFQIFHFNVFIYFLIKEKKFAFFLIIILYFRGRKFPKFYFCFIKRKLIKVVNENKKLKKIIIFFYNLITQ